MLRVFFFDDLFLFCTEYVRGEDFLLTAVTIWPSTLTVYRHTCLVFWVQDFSLFHPFCFIMSDNYTKQACGCTHIEQYELPPSTCVHCYFCMATYFICCCCCCCFWFFLFFLGGWLMHLFMYFSFFFLMLRVFFFDDLFFYFFIYFLFLS